MTSSIYAELLLNIRQITISISLSSKCNKDTRIEVTPDHETLILLHNGQACPIKLPGQVAGSTYPELPSQPTQDFSIRLPLGNGVATTGATATSLPPWSAHALTGATELACKNCGHRLLHTGRLHVWKDLPTENWAEMMDFWHCHKPDHMSSQNGQESLQKGYAATNKLAAQSGVGFVNVSSVLLSPDECGGVQVCDLSCVILYFINAKLPFSQ